MVKFTLQHVKKCFIDQKCEFLDNEYVNAQYSHNYICKCGQTSKISFSNFQKGRRCRKCCTEKQKHTLQHVKKCFIDQKCEFLDEEYIDANHPHNYICKCKNKSKISFSSFQKGRRCRKCAGTEKHTLQHVKKCFIDQKCEFIDEEYINSSFLHNYICKCKNKSKISFYHFQDGKRCKHCATSGFNLSKPSFVYLVGNHYKQKIGIMNVGTKRLKKHNKNFGLNLIDKMFFENGDDAMKLETDIKKKLKIKKIPHGRQVFTENFDGHTESWLLTDLEVTKIEELINL